ncbi:copper resistance CopC family protein [Nocardia sp. NPDC050697]|uniref:copper resistance CopC family protein n=1 Tax=Nocardia sp. NPDC050697 TaxID=3155158 RepID=UPI0033EC434D
MRALALTALAGLLVTIGTGTAAAHSIVVGSVPADGSSVEVGPERVSVTFNEPLQPSFPALTVVGPDNHFWQRGEPVVDGATVSVPVGELGPAGTYTIAFRVTSADGHAVNGKRTFTLTKAGSGTPGAEVSANEEGSGGFPAIPALAFVAGAVVIFGGGLAIALLGGRGRGKRA